MALSNYGELKASIASWLNRSDLTATIPDFISLAHKDINARVRHWRMLNRATAALDDEYTELPNDFLEAVRAQLNTSPIKELKIISMKEAAEKKASYFTSNGEPVFLAFGEEIQSVPAPDQSYTIEMLYYQTPTTLSQDTDSNWVLTYYPGLYLYGSLLHSAPFLHEDERLAVWAQLYNQTLESLKKDETGYQAQGGQVRTQLETVF